MAGHALLCRGLASLSFAVCVTGCLTAPALFEPLAGGTVELGGIERVEQRLPDGTSLSGLWLEAEPGAPVVLHLAGSGQSFSGSAQPNDVLLESFADLGFSSLALDYRGIGASEGERDVRHLRTDALAMWSAALERAGGDPARVVIRATSLGAVAAAEVLATGARPGALLLHAPVEGRSVVRHYARDQRGWWAALAARVYRPISRSMTWREVAESGVPAYASVPTQEAWVSEAEIEALREALAEDPRSRFERPDGGHVHHAFQSWLVDAREEAFVRALGLGHSAGSEVFDGTLDDDLSRRVAGEPALAERTRALAARVRGASRRRAVLAAIACDDDDLAVSWLRLARALLPSDVAPEAERAWFDLDDPLGPFPPELVVPLAWWALSLERQAPGTLPTENIVNLGLSFLVNSGPALRFRVQSGNLRAQVSVAGEGLERLLRPEGGAQHDYVRRRARLLLKLSGVPDRAVQDAQGLWVAAGFWDGRWLRLAADGMGGELEMLSRAGS